MRKCKIRLHKITAFAISLAMIVTLTSCDDIDVTEKIGEIDPRIENDVGLITQSTDEKKGEIIGNFQYPDNPSEDLRNALAADIKERGLPMEISEVEIIEFKREECAQIKINFTDGSENVCIITFANKHLDYSYDRTLDGRDNPSFTLAFKDADNSQDMITLLTSVIKYVSPDLSFEEAERLAKRQDDTISTDGYAMPQDIGGYQVQAQYTNPHVFAAAPDFEAKLGVRVRAIKQLWNGSIDTRDCQELLTYEDYGHLTANYSSWDEGNYPEMVYGDFIVKNMWQDQSYIHGETWVMVDIESMTGQQYSISLDTWVFPNTYEFGVGQQYTLFIGLKYVSGVRGGIMYAVQKSESEAFNSRGEVQPIDYPQVDWDNPAGRVEPENEGTVYDVRFILESQSYGDEFAALEGHGIGEKQWPLDPGWEGYTFVGWYDNLDYKGEPYTKDTPIYQDTNLYAKWKYSGPGGIWPRAHRGDIQGIEEGSCLSVGQKFTITASGYNMNLEAPRDQRFRWIPVSWRLSDGASGSFSKDAPFEATLSPQKQGEQHLYITYLEEVFDWIDWQSTGQTREVEEVSFQVK